MTRHMFMRPQFALTWIVLVALLAASVVAAGEKPFRIQVVDEQTKRGVPLVELTTVNNIVFVTDSAGVVAFDEPGLLGQRVFFNVKSHGYEFAKDGFGIRGKALDTKPGGSATLSIKRLNIAERLYRITGAGVYRDSVLLGEKPPTRQPLLNGLVLGQDSVLNAVYKGRLHWFWGDTNRPAYPLGNFHTPGATSALPAAGGLDPNVGVDLTYFVNEHGFAKPTAKMPGDGPTWLTGLTVVKDDQGRERMFAAYMKVKPPLSVYERGLCEWNDDRKEFVHVLTFPKDAPVQPGGHPFHYVDKGIEYVYFANPVPLFRVPATAESLQRLDRYEAFTCLKEGSRLDRPDVVRSGTGDVQYAWRKNTPPVEQKDQEALIKSGKLKPHEALVQLRDRDTGKPVMAHHGSVNWNAYRKRWVMIFVEHFGTSLLGEIWYAEADSPTGPWVHAVKIATHDRYSFYNPRQHPEFDQDGGRVIYFEGTYTNTFSGNPNQTPRYDYNQIMYKLDLADPRLRR